MLQPNNAQNRSAGDYQMLELTKARRCSQFTIRGMLLTFTVFGVWLGWLSHSARQQKEARGKLRNLGGDTHSYALSPGIQPLCNILAHGPPWVNSIVQVPLLAGVDFVSNVTGVRFGAGAHVNSDAVSVLRVFPHLEHIVFDRARVDPIVVLALEELPYLRHLTLENMPLTRPIADRLSSLQRLESLVHVGGVFSDKSWPALAKLHGLKQLDLSGSRLTWGGIWRLEQLLPQCNITPSTRSHLDDLMTVELDVAAIDDFFGVCYKESEDGPLKCRMGCEVVAIHPDGVLRLEGFTRSCFNGCLREASLEGDVHITDVELTDRGSPIVDSTAIANLKTVFREIDPDGR